MAANEISLTIKLDEDDWKAIERLSMTIEKRLARVEKILDARGLDWDHPRVADEPPKKWRILEPGEVVQEGDWMNAMQNSQEYDPPDGGWIPAPSFYFGREASVDFRLYFARLVADEPAKEPEHPAGPKPSPGEGYRILKKNPPEELQPGDEYELVDSGQWDESSNARTHRKQGPRIWYRRKIETPEPAWEPKVGDWVLVRRPEDWKEWKNPLWPEELHIYNGKVFQVRGAFDTSVDHRVTLHGCEWFFHRDWLAPAEPPKPPEPEYREPVLPGDFDRPCDFSSDGIEWRMDWLTGYVHYGWRDTNGVCWPCCRIKKDA